MKNADIFHLLGFSSVEQLKDIVVYPLRQKQDPAPRLHYCFLAAPLSYLHPLSSLISNCSSLPFGTQGRSWRLESIPYKQEMGDIKPSMPRSPHSVLLGFSTVGEKNKRICFG